MTAFAGALSPHLERFLKYKRALGYSYRNEEWVLHHLDRLATEVGLKDAVLTESFVRRFVTLGGGRSRPHFLTVARQFSRFVLPDVPQTFVPPRFFLGIRRRQTVIRVLSREEARRFLSVCEEYADKPTSRRNRLVHGTALWTLLMTGLRRGEALGLTDEDVDLAMGVLAVRRGKFGKSRFVPLAPDVVRRLQRYRDTRDARIPYGGPRSAFFPSSDGSRSCDSRHFYSSFRRALRMAGIAHHGRGNGPRLHDLRHSFACLRLLAWYEDGADLQAKLPLLATYLGHIGLKTTQVYLHMTHDLVGEVVHRQQERFGDVITAEVLT